MKYFSLVTLCFCFWSADACAQAPKEFNPYILRSISEVVEARKGGGYDIRNAFTRNIPYGDGFIKATAPPKTMCVAAVEEIILEAINLYAQDHGNAIYEKIPLTSWSKGNLAGLRANIFMFAGTGSRGTAHTLERFGLGSQLKFQELRLGDFVNFNRTSGSGHSAVFMGFLDRNGALLSQFSDDVAGFKYFSAQGKGKPDAGLAYRYAFFNDVCPNLTPEKRRDCKIIRSSNMVLLNAGRMYDPSEWRYDEAVEKIRAGVRSAFENAYPGQPRGFIDTLTDLELNRELEPVTELEDYFNGETTD